MGISSALFSGVSGLNTLGNSMSVIGDNIANVNTIGFKSSRSTFETVLAQSISGASGTSQVGRGVALSAVDANFAQGSFESTSEPTDMAIGGKGFFMLSPSEDDNIFYTRAGHFRFDQDGYLVNPADLRVQGWLLDPTTGLNDGSRTDILISATSSAPNPTSEISIAANLDSAADIIQSGATVASEEDSSDGFVFSSTGSNPNTSLTVNGTSYSLITHGGLDEGRVYSGAEVADALEAVINEDATGTATVLFNSGSGDENTFQIVTTDPAGLIIAEAVSNAAATLGITSDITTGGAAGSDDTQERRDYYVQTGVNDTFEITVDYNPGTGNPVPVRIDEGNYTGDELALVMEEQINSALANEGGVSVDVRYDESIASNKVFRITSSSRSTGTQIQLGPGINNFLDTVRISEFDSITEGTGPTVGGFTESSEPNGSKFYLETGINDEIVVDGVTVQLLDDGTTYTTAGYYTGDQIETAIEESILAATTLAGSAVTVDAIYDETNNTFAIENGTGATITFNWNGSSAAETLGYDPVETADDVTDGARTTGSSVAYNIIEGENDTMTLIVDGSVEEISLEIEPGVYTGLALAGHLETVINERLVEEGQDSTVVVEFDTFAGTFKIESSTLGEAGSIQITGFEGASDLVDEVLGIDDFTVNNGSGFQVDDPDDTSNYSTTLTVYDEAGASHSISVYFRKASQTDATANWEWFAYVPSGDTTSGDPEVQARGTLSFTSAGVLTSESTDWLTDSGGFDFVRVNTGQTVEFDFGLEGTNVTTQFRAPSSTIFQTQDGYGSGYLQDVAVDPDGVITGNYSNGQVIAVARVALANFTNPWGLSREGGNNYAATRASGEVLEGRPGQNGLGKISPNSLEQSNVDLSREFVDMIIQQRGFQANSKIITTTDQMLSELINLKR